MIEVRDLTATYGEHTAVVTPWATTGSEVIDAARSVRDDLRALAEEVGVGTARVDDVIDQVGLLPVAHRPVGRLSRTTAQRLGVARALLAHPRIVVLDEPDDGLDPEDGSWLRALLHELASEGRTVLLSSCVASDVELVVDHLVILERGRGLAEPPVRDLLGSTGTRVEVTSPAADELAELLTIAPDVEVVHRAPCELTVRGINAALIGEIAAGYGVVIDELRTVPASLEDASAVLTRHAGRSSPSTPASHRRPSSRPAIP